jgi:hypothetical protein
MLAREMDLVEHWKHRLQHVADALIARHRTVAVDPLLVVDVFGLQPAQVLQALGREGCIAGQRGDQRRLGSVTFRGGPVRHDRYAARPPSARRCFCGGRRRCP